MFVQEPCVYLLSPLSVVIGNNTFKTFHLFSGTFLAMAITAVTDILLANCFQILTGLLIYYQNCKFHMGSRVFLMYNWLRCKKKPRGSYGIWGLQYNHLPLEKIFYKSCGSSQKSNSWLISFIIFLGPCRIVLVNF